MYVIPSIRCLGHFAEREPCLFCSINQPPVPCHMLLPKRDLRVVEKDGKRIYRRSSVYDYETCVILLKMLGVCSASCEFHGGHDEGGAESMELYRYGERDPVLGGLRCSRVRSNMSGEWTEKVVLRKGWGLPQEGDVSNCWDGLAKGYITTLYKNPKDAEYSERILALLLEGLAQPVYDNYYSFAGSWSVSGKLEWDVSDWGWSITSDFTNEENYSPQVEAHLKSLREEMNSTSDEKRREELREILDGDTWEYVDRQFDADAQYVTTEEGHSWNDEKLEIVMDNLAKKQVHVLRAHLLSVLLLRGIKVSEFSNMYDALFDDVR